MNEFLSNSVLRLTFTEDNCETNVLHTSEMTFEDLLIPPLRKTSLQSNPSMLTWLLFMFKQVTVFIGLKLTLVHIYSSWPLL